MAIEKIEINIPLEGVESEHCAMLVDKGLSKLHGIESHRVELNNKRAVLQVAKLENIKEAVNTIRDLGYGVNTNKKSFPVLKMTCASCAVSVESMLKAQKGVLYANVNFANATVSVEFITGAVTELDLKKTVQSIGYDLMIEESKSSESALESMHLEKFTMLKRKTLWALILSLPLVVIGMFYMEMNYANEIMWILSTPIVLWLGRDFFVNAWKQARHRSVNMDTLVALSTGSAYLFSVFNTMFPHYWHERGLHAHVYFEAASVIIAFILLGKLLEERAKDNTSSAIRKLMGLKPKSVTIIQDDGSQILVPIDELKIGDLVMVKPGEKIAVDGTVISGDSFVDESMLSGEPLAVLKNADAKVFAGTLNQKGSFQFRAEKVGEDTMLAQIIRMVQDAQGSKAPVQKLVDRIAGIFVPVVITIALLSFVIWNVSGVENAFNHGLLALITVLIIACPCALGLATPTAIMVGVGKGAELGILIKDAESLESAKKINAIVLDKTGTITEGKPVLTDEYWLNDDDVLKSALMSIESQSEHPLADAIATHLKSQKNLVVSGFESITGRGVKASIDGETYYVGNQMFVVESGITIGEVFREKADKWSSESKSIIWFAWRHEVIAVLAVADRIKGSSKKAIDELKEMGIDVYMLTGDNSTTAKSIAQNVGILHYKAEVLPDQKAAFIKELQLKGKVVAMVGDGINDGAALAQADVSIAMGKGSDIAMDVAKMTIISSDLVRIPDAIRLSRSTVRTIEQNLFWAFFYNLIGIPIAAGILFPFNGFLLNPMLAGAAMAFSSVSVVGNSLRLKFKK